MPLQLVEQFLATCQRSAGKRSFLSGGQSLNMAYQLVHPAMLGWLFGVSQE
jgi:hypothetical protein